MEETGKKRADLGQGTRNGGKRPQKGREMLKYRERKTQTGRKGQKSGGEMQQISRELVKKAGKGPQRGRGRKKEGLKGGSAIRLGDWQRGGVAWRWARSGGVGGASGSGHPGGGEGGAERGGAKGRSCDPIGARLRLGGGALRRSRWHFRLRSSGARHSRAGIGPFRFRPRGRTSTAAPPRPAAAARSRPNPRTAPGPTRT